MQVTVRVPASLRQYSGGASKVCIECAEPSPTLASVLARMHALHPGVVERALDERGAVRPHVNVFVNGENIRTGSAMGMQTPVAAGAEVWILPAVSGG
jgi:molybdopterin converting factor small subunit